MTSAPRDGADPAILTPAEAEAADLRQATRALVDKLRLVQPAIENVFTLASCHGVSYEGPTYAAELARVDRLLGEQSLPQPLPLRAGGERGCGDGMALADPPPTPEPQ